MTLGIGLKSGAASSKANRGSSLGRWTAQKAVWALLTFGVLTGSVQAANILVNGDFEADSLSPWYAQGRWEVVERDWVPADTMWHGLHSARALWVGTYPCTMAQDIPAVRGADITECSMWAVSTDLMSHAATGVFRLVASDGSAVSASFPPPDTGWHQLILTGFDPEKSYVRCEVAMWGGLDFGFTGWVDDARIEVVPEPACLGLLALGSLAFIARRRR